MYLPVPVYEAKLISLDWMVNEGREVMFTSCTNSKVLRSVGSVITPT